ncbi:hypothetical protein HK101_010987 [Irineochytrium annulatum]|nr:hypothetical protein HK101_010987 [Irineochytrium annulatum]
MDPYNQSPFGQNSFGQQQGGQQQHQGMWGAPGSGPGAPMMMGDPSVNGMNGMMMGGGGHSQQGQYQGQHHHQEQQQQQPFHGEGDHDGAAGASSGTGSGSGSGHMDEAALKRKRITQACDACNKKKVKCDGQKPTCNNCQKSSSSCSYSRGAKKRGPRAGYIESLENRLKEMEALLQPLQPDLLPGQAPANPAGAPSNLMDSWGSTPSIDDGSNPFSVSPIIANPLHQQPQFHQGSFTNTLTGSTNISNGINPKHSHSTTLMATSFNLSNPNAASRNPQSSSTPPQSSHSHQLQYAQHTNHTQQQNLNQPPQPIPAEAVRELVDLYFRYVHPTMPLLHRNSFLANHPRESPLLMNAMYALAARYSSHPSIVGSPPAVDASRDRGLPEDEQSGDGPQLWSSGDVFYVKARELVDHFMDVPNTSTVTALLLLAAYAAGSGRGSAAWMYSGMAIRMAQEIKLNVEPEFDEAGGAAGGGGVPGGQPAANGGVSGAGMTWLEREKRRRIWWTCFILDRYAGAAADRSMIISEKDCKVYLPCKEDVWETIPGFSTDEPTEQTPPDSLSFQVSVLTSTSAFTPGIPMQSPFGYFVLLTKIFGKLIEHSNLYKTPKPTSGSATGSPSPSLSQPNGAIVGVVGVPGNPTLMGETDKEYQLSILDASLRNWHASTPHWMKALLDTAPPPLADDVQTLTRRTAFFGCAYLQIFYHTCLILLHRPKMMTLVREQPSTVAVSPSFAVCRSSAQEVCDLLVKMGAGQTTAPGQTSGLIHMTAFVAFCIFQSGLIHVMATQVATGDPALVERSRRSAEVHSSALGEVARYWFMAGRLHSVLRGLIHSASVPRGVEDGNSGMGGGGGMRGGEFGGGGGVARGVMEAMGGGQDGHSGGAMMPQHGSMMAALNGSGAMQVDGGVAGFDGMTGLQGLGAGPAVSMAPFVGMRGADGMSGMMAYGAGQQQQGGMFGSSQSGVGPNGVMQFSARLTGNGRQ